MHDCEMTRNLNFHKFHKRKENVLRIFDYYFWIKMTLMVEEKTVDLVL